MSMEFDKKLFKLKLILHWSQKWLWKKFRTFLVEVIRPTKLQNSDFQSHFSMSKIIRIFLKKNFIGEYQFKSPTFAKPIFWLLHFKKRFIPKMTEMVPMSIGPQQMWSLRNLVQNVQLKVQILKAYFWKFLPSLGALQFWLENFHNSV
jgi:hypothetical protein